MQEDHVGSETPNWSELDIELSCPRCSYDLRMLTLPRCPECGLHFQWDELIRAEREFHIRPPIFEYRWRTNPIRSLALTISMCLQPWRLWRWLPLTAVPSVRTMPFLLVLVLTLLALVSASGDFIWHEFIKLYYETFRGQSNFRGFSWNWWFSSVLQEVVTPSLLLLAIWCSIQLFRQTITRYRVRQGHILRIIVFCWIGVVGWQVLAEFVLTLFAMPYLWIYHRSIPYRLLSIVDLVPPIILLLSLGFGFRSYLRVRGGWLWALLLVVFTSILIVLVGLIVSTVVLDTFDNQYWRYLTDWSQPFTLLRDLASWALRSLPGY